MVFYIQKNTQNTLDYLAVYSFQFHLLLPQITAVSALYR